MRIDMTQSNHEFRTEPAGIAATATAMVRQVRCTPFAPTALLAGGLILATVLPIDIEYGAWADGLLDPSALGLRLIRSMACIGILVATAVAWRCAVTQRRELLLLRCANSELARHAAALEHGRHHFAGALDNVTQGICLIDRERKLQLWNRRYAEIYALDPSALSCGLPLLDVAAHRSAGSGGASLLAPYFVWMDTLGCDAAVSSTVLTLANGRHVAVTCKRTPDGGWASTHEDVTERRQAEADVVFLARHDALTRLPNRVMFWERMEQAMAQVGRGIGCAVLCLDLDRFKLVNDTLGHPVGDRLLQAVADRLQACVREVDTVARFGGDEFAVIQFATERPEKAELLAKRIIQVVGDPFEIDGHQILIGASIGVSLAPFDGTSPERLLKNADIALYLAKSEGRGTVRFFEPEMDARIQRRRTLEVDLRNAFARDQLEVHYQPLVDLAVGGIRGFEALLRWQHPVRGVVSPAEFIPLAEETGLIVPIGEWLLRAACVEATRWPVDISVAVNLSPVQFRKGKLVETVKAALDLSGLSPVRLEIEIAEAVLLQDTIQTLASLHELRRMGILVALDDFGTGYSSLSYLRSFPFDKIKIDQSFIRSLADEDSMAVIRAVTGLGRNFCLKTTAEGVETLEQLERLREEGCTEVQGYLFSQPVPAADLPGVIRRLHHAGQGVT
jgi:diguanylate cyclase (GGDEF)-like protein